MTAYHRGQRLRFYELSTATSAVVENPILIAEAREYPLWTAGAEKLALFPRRHPRKSEFAPAGQTETRVGNVHGVAAAAANRRDGAHAIRAGASPFTNQATTRGTLVTSRTSHGHCSPVGPVRVRQTPTFTHRPTEMYQNSGFPSSPWAPTRLRFLHRQLCARCPGWLIPDDHKDVRTPSAKRDENGLGKRLANDKDGTSNATSSVVRRIVGQRQS